MIGTIRTTLPGSRWRSLLKLASMPSPASERHRLRAEGRLRFLAPGEEVRYQLELGALFEKTTLDGR